MEIPPGGTEAARVLEQLSLPDQEVLLAGLFETVPVTLQVFDLDGHSLLVNPTFLKIFGRTPPPEYSLLKDEILERHGMLPVIRKAFEGEAVVTPPAWYDVRELKGFDHTGVIGQRIGIQGTMLPLFGRDGALRYVAVWGRIVTAEMELTDREERQSMAFAAARLMALDVNLTKQTLRTSNNAHELLGLGASVPLESLGDLLALVHPEDRERVAAFELDRSGAGPLDHAFRLERPGASGAVWLERRGQVWHDAVSDDTWRRGILMDISERVAREAALRGSEAALRRTEAQLRQAQKLEAVGRLAGGIAHDFNNLLSVVIAYSDLLLAGGELAPLAHEGLKAIRAAGEQATHLTSQLLTVSRQQVLALRVLDVGEVVGSTTDILRRVLGENVELHVRGADGPACVRADAGQLEQVVMNLAINARDAMPEGGTLTIETRNVVLDEAEAHEHMGLVPGPHVLLLVSDTGIGMDKQTQSHIFEPFFTTKPTGKGSGLGLATVFGIVQQSRGHIAVTSEPAKGTRFELRFPRVDAPPEAKTASSAPTTLRGHETVLLVEDQKEVRRVVREVLARYGYVVLDAESPSDALAVCEQHEGAIDLLLTDIVMPQMNGRELAQRATRVRPKMRVLLMSGYTDDTMVQRGTPGTGFAHLQKPIVPEVLARRLREVLAAPPSQDADP